jgi:cellulose synthase/poly-beta-1,6-N-acetylglucosamine synthase-like glycosyltransferase
VASPSSNTDGLEQLMTLLKILIDGTALLLLVPVLVLFTEILLAVANRNSVAIQVGDRRRLAVVIPAHNEALSIVETLRSIVPQLDESDRLIVVADNCTDETSAIATREGAEAIIRTDIVRHGKGYALDFGVRHLQSDAPDVVIFVDADCLVSSGSIDRLARLCDKTARPIQALYLMHAKNDDSLNMRIAEFAWTVKNQVRPMGLHRLGLPCQLMGTGMAFSWACISTAKLATGHIVEDLKLGIDLARAGKPPLFCPEALVTSDFPASSEGVQSQRTRWEHGHLTVILSEAPRLFLNSLATLNANSMALALDLSVPPLALLTLLVMAVWFASVFFFLFTKSPFPLAVATAAAVLLVLSVLLSWRAYARHIISLGSLAFAMIHAFVKIPLYLRFIVARQLKWVRTKREAGPP